MTPSWRIGDDVRAERGTTSIGHPSCDATARIGCLACQRRIESLWRWKRHVTRFVARRAPTEEHAADAVASAYVVAWQRLQNVPTDDDSARAWLCVTAWRLLANSRRRDAHQAMLQAALRRQSRAQSATAADDERISAADAYRQLAPADRRILALAAAGGPTLAELAFALGCTSTAAGARLSRARQRLNRAFETS